MGHHGHRHHGHVRHGLHSARKLSAADLQLIILALLEERPAHGYELIKALDDHSSGFYAPSPGAVYPALTYLEEIGYATVELDGARKRYSLTQDGLSQSAQNRDYTAGILSDLKRIGSEMARAREAIESGQSQTGAEIGPASQELEGARIELRRSQRRENPYTADECRRVAAVLKTAAEEIRTILSESERTP